MRKAFGALAVLATCAVVGITASMALAVPLSNPGEFGDANCSTAAGTQLHFVHNQTSAASGTITVQFTGGTVVTADTPHPSTTLHYFVTSPGGTLISASDTPQDGRLVLSDCGTAPPPPPPPPPV